MHTLRVLCFISNIPKFSIFEMFFLIKDFIRIGFPKTSIIPKKSRKSNHISIAYFKAYMIFNT